ncbi:MAG: response regulator [Bacteroidota bacterium]
MTKILVIEDETMLRESIRDILGYEGFTVLEAGDGKAGIDMALLHTPDLILCDILLPVMDGYEVLKKIQSHEHLKLTPFIYITALTKKSNIRSGMELGADDYITKPFNRADLLKSISARLEKATIVREKDAHLATLETINRELSDYASFVSHDLKMPLRLIDMYAQILANEYGTLLGKDGMKYLLVIRENTGKMVTLIDGMLTFARQRKTGLRRSVVNMKKLVQSIIDAGSQPDQAQRVAFTLSELHNCSCDRTMMRQVLSNLISNAIKFSSKRDHPAVEIGSFVKDEEIVYFVRDNGVGMDMRDEKKLFGLFNRLHPESEFDGIGVGLAIVKDIIEKHQGRVWAESAVNEGATFYFTVPPKQAIR